MQELLDIIQAIARQRGRGEASPLLALRQIEGLAGERVAHLPIETELAQAWLALTGEPFRPHQAQAVTALRRSEPVALSASDSSVTISAYMLIYALLTQNQSSAIVIAPDNRAALDTRAVLTRINENLPQLLRLPPYLIEPNIRPNPYARIVIATPDTLHNRLLRHHDRAWNLFWPKVRLLALPNLHHYIGVAGGHMADMMLRIQRIAREHSGSPIPHLLATMLDVLEPQPALENLYAAPWRVIPADDTAHVPTTLAVWHGVDRLREASELAMGIKRHGYHVHIACDSLEIPALLPMVGDTEDVTIGPTPQPGHVLISAGYPGSYSALRRLLRAGYHAVVVVLGERPHEQMLARHADALFTHSPSYWPPSTPNAYITAQHILCAATESPLTEEEVDSWGARAIVDRMVDHNQLVDLPDAEVAWKPGRAAGDPYAEFSLLSPDGSGVLVRSEQGRQFGQFDPSSFERWGFPNAALPPGNGGLRVINRDEEASAVAVRLESNGRRTYPLRRCTVAIREQRDSRALLHSTQVSLGRVVVEEEVFGYRESTPNSAPAEITLKPTLHTRWIAPACWIDLTMDVQASGQFIGWSLAAAIPLLTLAAYTDIVPCYDQKSRRLYFVDSQPGGHGLASWLYQHAEDVLPLAYDVAHASRYDSLLEPMARADMDWLLPLLGRRAERPALVEPATQKTASRVDTARMPEFIEGPPPAAPRIILTPPAPELVPREEPPRRPATDDRRAGDDRRTAPDDRRPPTDDRRIGVDRRAAPDDRQPLADDRRIGGDRRIPDDNEQLPADDRRTGGERRLTTDSHQPPADDRRTGGERHVPDNDQRPTAAQEQTVSAKGSETSAEPMPEPPAQNTKAKAADNRQTKTRRSPRRAEEKSAHSEVADLPVELPSKQRAVKSPKQPERDQTPAPDPQGAANDDQHITNDKQRTTSSEQATNDTLPDASALIERLRRQRQQREAQHAPKQSPAAGQTSAVELRFTPGERVFCLPYGDGVVRQSRAEGGREMLTIAFPSFGELTIDPAVSLVRKLEAALEDEDDLL